LQAGDGGSISARVHDDTALAPASRNGSPAGAACWFPPLAGVVSSLRGYSSARQSAPFASARPAVRIRLPPRSSLDGSASASSREETHGPLRGWSLSAQRRVRFPYGPRAAPGRAALAPHPAQPGTASLLRQGLEPVPGPASGAVAQLVERCHGMAEVRGSSPLSSTRVGRKPRSLA
jgi:hypothetical protein